MTLYKMLWLAKKLVPLWGKQQSSRGETDAWGGLWLAKKLVPLWGKQQYSLYNMLWDKDLLLILQKEKIVVLECGDSMINWISTFCF